MELPSKVGHATRTMGLVRPLFPIGMLIVGSWIPTMRIPITIPPTDDLWKALVVEIILAVIWIISEIITVVDKDTTVRQLRWDDFISLWIAIPMATWCGWLIAWQKVEWWFIVPFVAALLDATLSGYLGINNAAQKPIIHGPRE